MGPLNTATCDLFLPPKAECGRETTTITSRELRAYLLLSQVLCPVCKIPPLDFLLEVSAQMLPSERPALFSWMTQNTSFVLYLITLVHFLQASAL